MENFPHHPLLYYNQNAKKTFLQKKSGWGSWNSWGSSALGASLESSVVIVIFGFLSVNYFVDFLVIESSLWFSLWLFRRVLSERFLSWVISPFFPVCQYFFNQKVLLRFLIKKRFSVLHDIFKKMFTVNN